MATGRQIDYFPSHVPFVDTASGKLTREGRSAMVVRSATGGLLAFDITFAPSGSIPDTNVQEAIESLDATKVSATALAAHTGNTTNPHAVTKAQVGLGNVDNTSDVNKPVSTATAAALAAHTGDTGNPHSVTKSQVGLGNVDNTSDLAKPISTATQNALNLKANSSSLGTMAAQDSNAVSITAGTIVLVAGAIGYGIGNGGTVTQITSKSTGATLNELSGEVTMHNAALAAGTVVNFVLTNSTAAATDVVIRNHVSGGTIGAYSIEAVAGAGQITFYVRNNTAGSLSEAVVIRFAVIKGATS